MKHENDTKQAYKDDDYKNKNNPTKGYDDRTQQQDPRNPNKGTPGQGHNKSDQQKGGNKGW